MTREHREKLKALGIYIQHIQYNYPDENWMKEMGFWNYEQYMKTIGVSVNLEITDANTARKLEQNLLILAEAQASDNPAVQNLLDQLETLIGLTK